MSKHKRGMATARRYADGGVTDPTAGMSPVDLVRLRAELAAKRQVSPEQRRANLRQTAEEALGIVPVIGNALSARDAVTSAGDTATALGEGRYRDAAGNAVLTGIGALGAVTGLPWGRGAREAAASGSSTARIFAGPSAKTADMSALARAEEMRAAGIDRDVIWRETGWGWGTDGKPRFEIDDSKAAIDLDNLIDENRALGDVLIHPEFYAAYPDAKNVLIKKHDFGNETKGDYERSYHDEFDPAKIRLSADDRSISSLLGTTLHETQHHVQTKEGFSSGSSPEVARDWRNRAQLDELEAPYSARIDELYRVAAAAREAGDDVARQRAWAELGPLMQLRSMLKTKGYGAYFRNTGEVEARNTTNRRRMDAAERRASSPWNTQDVPDEMHIATDADDRLMRPKRADGGSVMDRARRYADGGVIGTGRPERGVIGGVRGETDGRGDRLSVTVPAGAYVVPADVVSALGGGNTEAGMTRLAGQFGDTGGRRGDAPGAGVPIQISHGEFVIGPEAVAQAGGPEMMDAFILKVRERYAHHLTQLPGPNT